MEMRKLTIATIVLFDILMENVTSYYLHMLQRSISISRYQQVSLWYQTTIERVLVMAKENYDSFTRHRSHVKNSNEMDL